VVETHFFPTDVSAVHATLGMTGPLPSTDLIFAVCISALTPTTSKMPWCCVLLTRCPGLGAVTLESLIVFASLICFDRPNQRGLGKAILDAEGKQPPYRIDPSSRLALIFRGVVNKSAAGNVLMLRIGAIVTNVVAGSARERSMSDEPFAELTEDTAALVGEARRGNPAAFGRLYQLHARVVHGILLTRVPRLEVDDLVQEVFLSALRQLVTLRDGAAFGAWVAAIARNRASDFHRKIKETVTLLEQDSPIENSHADDSSHAQALEALTAIRKLPDAYRETLMLRLVEGMTGPEIAERTGLTPESVRVNLHRGMKMLREALRKGASRE
jgi:RNA polymerase sigma-70 factor, ECF subfamily